MTSCCGGGPLPITTGRIGISQTDGSLTFYGHNYRGTGIGLFYGQSCWYPPPCPPTCGCGSMCCSGCGGCSCCGTCSCKCFVSLLTNIGPWCRYWTDQQYSAWLTGQQPWPPTAAAANTTLQSTLPAACFPPAPSPAAQAALASIGVH
jgi:hypothetical protein